MTPIPATIKFLNSPASQEKCTMYDVLTVADTLLKIAKKRGQSLTPIRLVKLTYIAHGWSLGLRNKGLFWNRIEAWQYGPVIPDLYFPTKFYGCNPIPLNAVDDPNDIRVSPDDYAFLEGVFNIYGEFDGIRLSYLAHQSGTPWQQVHDQNIRAIEIPNALIAQYYRDQAKEQHQ